MKLAALLHYKRWFKQSIIFSLMLSLSVYTWARILFYEVPFTVQEDIPIIVKTILLCWIMVLGLFLTFNLIVKIAEGIQRQLLSSPLNKKWIVGLSAVLFLSAFLFSCNN